MKTTAIVLTYNWPEALGKVLGSLAAQTRLPNEVIIADDGSTQDTTDLINRTKKTFAMPLRHIWQEDNGFRAARCRNKGIAAARGDYIVLLDGDMLLHRHFIADHLALAKRGFFLRGKRIKATAQETSKLLQGAQPTFAPWSNAQFGAFDCTRRRYAFRAPWLARIKARKASYGMVMSCNMSFWRDDLIKVNGFDERMEGYGSEDRELAVRLENAGVQPCALKWAGLAVHLDHPTRSQVNVDAPHLPNNRLLAETIEHKITRCDKGIDSHLN